MKTKRPLFRWFLVLFALMAGLGLFICPAGADDSKKSPSPADDPVSVEVKVIPLKHVGAVEMTRTLQTILDKNVRYAVDENANALVVRASAADMAQVVDVIKKVDTPRPDNEPPRPELKIYELRTIEPDKALEDSLRLVFPKGATGNFSVDRTRKLVVVSADKVTLEKVDALLARLDMMPAHPADQDVQVRVVWLANGAGDDKGPRLPDDLKEVAPGLAKLGIDQPRIVAQSLVTAKPNTQFQAKGVAKLGGDTPCRFAVSGRFTDKKESPELQIMIRATRAQPSPSPEICNLQTEIDAPLGHLVVLGVTPTESATAAFVIQVSRKETTKPAPKK